MGTLLATVLVLVVLCLAVPAPTVGTGSCNDLTAGFVKVQLPESDFVVQSPYDLPVEQRYRYDACTGVRTFWVYAGDKPFNNATTTNPRTEVRLRGHDYSSGVWQFEGYGHVPSGTTGVSIMQVFGASESATTLMLHVYDGALRYYDRQVVEDNIYDRWFRLNVVHDVGASTMAVFVDGVERLRAPGRGGCSHYFKFGVYAQNHASSCMESHWKDIRIFRKDY